jgi:transaldolase
VYERDGLDGYASLEVAPDLAHDADATLTSALDLWRRLDRPNMMIKIPGTPAGVEAIRRATAAGININVTLLFAVEAYEQVADAYLAGLEERLAGGEAIREVVSVASFFVSRVETAVDRLLAERGRDDLAGRAGIATRGPRSRASGSCSPASALPHSPDTAPAGSGRCGPRPASRTSATGTRCMSRSWRGWTP